MPDSAFHRRLPIGAEPVDFRTSHVRLWAPRPRRVEVITVPGTRTSLTREDGGYFSGTIPASAGDRYQFKLDDDDRLYPDPASRSQPEGPHGPSEIVDPAGFRWTDQGWTGAPRERRVLYELHVGTHTRRHVGRGGRRTARARAHRDHADRGDACRGVRRALRLGVRRSRSVRAVAPVRRARRLPPLVDTAHAAGLGVILDVVYNHLGPAGNYLRQFAPAYFTDRYENEWGDSINFDGADAAPVREFFVTNAGYWIEEFHLDGLRLDATQSIHDCSSEHILAAVGVRARDAAAGRAIVLVAENEPQDTRLVRPLEDGGYGLDALWNDDFHHSAMVALTGRAEAYYSDTRGEPQEFVSAAKYGYLFQGQHYDWQRNRRGSAAWGLPPSAFIAFTQNHDQVANSARGLRGHLLTSPGRWRAMTALLLLSPATPMLFQGQGVLDRAAASRPGD